MKLTIEIEVWDYDNEKRYYSKEFPAYKYGRYNDTHKTAWLIKGQEVIKMSLGEINISKKRSNCAKCLGIIPKHRKRISIYGYFRGFKDISIKQHYHLDCYKLIMKNFLKKIKDNLKTIKVSKKYIKQKEGDLLIQQL